MKTQIIRRIVLAAVALFFYCNNNNSNVQLTNQHSLTVILKEKKATLGFTASVNTKNSFQKPACITCKITAQENALPVVPEPNGDHEFHSFHVKDKHSKHAGFWKNIANKLMSAVYYVVVLVVYLPYKYLS